MKLDRNLVAAVEELVAVSIADQLKEVKATIAEQMKAVANEPRINYRDIWSVEETYMKYDVATHGGGLWLALRDNGGMKPGLPEHKSDPYWKLIVKRADRLPPPTLTLDKEGTLMAHSPDGSSYVIGSIKELIVGLLQEHGVIPVESGR